MSPTTTALLALTTPFVAPPGCPVFRTLGSIDAVTVLVADDPSCMPGGWDDIAPESRFSFNPGVCPSGWVYYNIADGESIDEFTAFCCDRYVPLCFPK